MSPSVRGPHDGAVRRTDAGDRRPTSRSALDEAEVAPAELADVLRKVADRLDAVLDTRPSTPTPGRAGSVETSLPSASAGDDVGQNGHGRGARQRDEPEGIDTLVLRLSHERANADAGGVPVGATSADGGQETPATDRKPEADDDIATESAAESAGGAATESFAGSPAEAEAEAGAEPSAESAVATASAVDAQLGSVRQRMRERRAVVAVDDAPARPWRPWRPRSDPRGAAPRVARRILVVVAIVAVSAAVSLAVF